jgi:di/tricarboxylate transporter
VTLHQTESLIIIAVMFALFAWDRIRYDLVAMLTLLAGLLTGVVSPERGFTGFGNQVIIVIASVLVISRAIAVSGLVESLMRRLMRRVTSTSMQVGVYTACTTFMSSFVKNVGTLGIFMPIAIRTAERFKRSPSIYLMPLAFGSLIGGTITQIGTSPNLLISSIRQDITGAPFEMFDFTAVGLPLSCVAVVFLTFGWRLIPKGRTGTPAPERKFAIAKYMSELRVGPQSPLIGKTVRDLETLTEDDVVVTAIIREGGRRYIPAGDWTFFADDIVAIQADPLAVKTLRGKTRLELLDAEEHATTDTISNELEIVEAIVRPDSPLVGRSPGSMRLRARHEVNLLSVHRAGTSINTQLRHHVFEAGDVVMLQGGHKRLPAVLAELGCLPLADRSLGVTRRRKGWISLTILAVAMALVAFKLLNVAVAFFGSAVLVIALRQVSLKEAYEAVEWPVIIMLGALIPVGEALKEVGTTEILGQQLTHLAVLLPGWGALALILLVSMLVTPLLHHAAAVIVMGPIAAVVAYNLGYDVDPFLMAVALGASSDFLTPIGHQNNAIIMAPGGYRFFDYWRLGLPLSIMVVVAGTALIMLFWPL